jgi:hypothetical protein
LATLCEWKGQTQPKVSAVYNINKVECRRGKDALIDINMLWTNTCTEICGQREGVKVTTINVNISRQ